MRPALAPTAWRTRTATRTPSPSSILTAAGLVTAASAAFAATFSFAFMHTPSVGWCEPANGPCQSTSCSGRPLGHVEDDVRKQRGDRRPEHETHHREPLDQPPAERRERLAVLVVGEVGLRVDDAEEAQ